MFSLLRGALTLLICVLAVGFYFGWFSFHPAAPDPQSDKVNVNVSVDEKKMGSDLRKFEENVTKRIQDINTQPQQSTPAPPPGQQPVTPRLNLGPISVTPSGLPGQFNNNQPSPPTFSLGPISVGPSNPAARRPTAHPPARRRSFSSPCPWRFRPRATDDSQSAGGSH